MPAGELAKAAELSAPRASPRCSTTSSARASSSGAARREDRRVVVVSLTAQGRELLDAKRAVWQQRWREALAGFSDDELAAAAAILGRVRGLFEGL